MAILVVYPVSRSSICPLGQKRPVRRLAGKQYDVAVAAASKRLLIGAAPDFHAVTDALNGTICAHLQIPDFVLDFLLVLLQRRDPAPLPRNRRANAPTAGGFSRLFPLRDSFLRAGSQNMDANSQKEGRSPSQAPGV